jgi:hypothetical protein
MKKVLAALLCGLVVARAVDQKSYLVTLTTK